MLAQRIKTCMHRLKVFSLYSLFLILFSCFLIPYSVKAEVPISKPDLSQPTGIAPAFFGPNALPIIDMSDGLTDNHLRLELAADGYIGFQNNNTVDIFARVRVPLFTRWANLSVWMPVYGWYKQYDGTGSGAGDVYISTDVQVDLAMGQSIPLKALTLRFAGSVGFLCWQTDNGRQNDAVMYGLQAQLRHEFFSLQATWGGYVGWERYGDAPMSIKARAAGHVKGFEPYVQYQYGIKDYPFHQIRVGLVYNLDILGRATKK